MRMVRDSASACPADAGDGRRWLAVGWSGGSDSVAAGRRAALDALRGVDAKLLLAFCSAGHDPAAVVSGMSAVAGSVPLVGCASEAVVTPEGPDGAGIAVVALGGAGFSVTIAAARASGGRQRQAGAEVGIGCLAGAELRPNRVLMLLTDGLTADQEVILSGVYGVVGASMPLIGGSVSPAPVATRAIHVHGTKTGEDPVVGILIGSDGPIGIGLRHGWRRVGDALVVTHSANGTVKTLNDQPALTAYLDRLRAGPETYLDREAFHQFARTRPIGVSRRAGESLRDVSSFDYFDEGWLHSSGEIPEGGLIWPMEADVDCVLAAADAAARSSIAPFGAAPALGLLAFGCVSRRTMLGEEGTRQEVDRLAKVATPVTGIYTWGEIGRTEGVNAYHNLTMAVLALG